ncbi:unnamed protein product [Peronospora destructor]|uniref:UBX domain-containing protein n=1 Tax=Peronospora destructor TaxID=86335 RepID=A0AAV0VAQ7_9STRA|nr:unnamed protein product [Peronospora destructor]
MAKRPSKCSYRNQNLSELSTFLTQTLEVDMIPCEAVIKAKETEKRMAEEAARIVALAQEKERWKANKMATLLPEPAAEERESVKVVVRMPEGQATRRFLHSSPLRSVFNFVEAPHRRGRRLFRLAATYPVDCLE